MPPTATRRRLRSLLLATAVALVAFGISGVDAPPAAVRMAAAQVAVEGTRFQLRDADGHVLPQAALVGAVLAIDDAAGVAIEIRIDAVFADPGDDEITLYGLAQRDARGQWQPLCGPGPDGIAAGFPVDGEWTAEGEHRPLPGRFGLSCTSGAVAKCVRMGYKYWAPGPEQAPMWDLHQACTRMLRADYCGNGDSYTRDGTVVNVADRWGIQRADPEPSRFEAAWDAHGAVCVERSRLGDAAALEGIAARCPGRFVRRGPGACDTDSATGDRRALLTNRS